MDILNLRGHWGRQMKAREPTQNYPWAPEQTQSSHPVLELVPKRTKSCCHLQYSVYRQKDRAPRWSVQTVGWGQELPLESTQNEMMAVMQMKKPLAPDRKLQSQRRALKWLELGCLQNQVEPVYSRRHSFANPARQSLVEPAHQSSVHLNRRQSHREWWQPH